MSSSTFFCPKLMLLVMHCNPMLSLTFVAAVTHALAFNTFHYWIWFVTPCTIFIFVIFEESFICLRVSQLLLEFIIITFTFLIAVTHRFIAKSLVYRFFAMFIIFIAKSTFGGGVGCGKV